MRESEDCHKNWVQYIGLHKTKSNAVTGWLSQELEGNTQAYRSCRYSSEASSAKVPAYVSLTSPYLTSSHVKWLNVVMVWHHLGMRMEETASTCGS